jgi:arsenate reductase (thioredoxin)
MEMDADTTRSDTPAVLFLCVHNAGRSQMAAGWLQHLADGRVEVLSAGSEPAEQVNPSAIEAMAEVGIDLRGREPKRWDLSDLEVADVVVTMGCGDTCPVLPGKRYVDWPLADPAGQGVEAVRPIRDEIERRIRGLMDELGVAPRDAGSEAG